MTILKKIFISYWKSIVIISCILYLSFASPATFKGIPTFENEDKLVHALMYIGLTMVLIFDFLNIKRNNINSFAFVLLCLIFPVFLGGVIEILQENFFPPRTASWYDWIADITGVLAGWFFMYMIRKLNSRIVKY